MNERLDRNIVRDNIVLDKYSKILFDAYMEDGCYIQNIEINGPVLVSYKNCFIVVSFKKDDRAI